MQPPRFCNKKIPFWWLLSGFLKTEQVLTTWKVELYQRSVAVKLNHWLYWAPTMFWHCCDIKTCQKRKIAYTKSTCNDTHTNCVNLFIKTEPVSLLGLSLMQDSLTWNGTSHPSFLCYYMFLSFPLPPNLKISKSSWYLLRTINNPSCFI